MGNLSTKTELVKLIDFVKLTKGVKEFSNSMQNVCAIINK